LIIKLDNDQNFKSSWGYTKIGVFFRNFCVKLSRKPLARLWMESLFAYTWHIFFLNFFLFEDNFALKYYNLQRTTNKNFVELDCGAVLGSYKLRLLLLDKGKDFKLFIWWRFVWCKSSWWPTRPTRNQPKENPSFFLQILVLIFLNKWNELKWNNLKNPSGSK
jgi:hypothetical protein